MRAGTAVKPGLRYSGFGKLVRDRRREIGMTQAALGELVGIPQDLVSKIELGVATHRPTYERAIAIVRALDLPDSVIESATEDAIAGVDQQLAAAWEISTRPMDDLAQLVPGLPPADQRTLVRLARVMAAGRLVDRG